MLTLSILIYYMNKGSNPLSDSSVNFDLSRLRVEGGTLKSPITPKVTKREGGGKGSVFEGTYPLELDYLRNATPRQGATRRCGAMARGRV